MNTIKYWISTQDSIKAALISAYCYNTLGLAEASYHSRFFPRTSTLARCEELSKAEVSNLYSCGSNKIGDLQARFTKAIHDPPVNPFLPILQSRRLISSLPRLPQTARIELPVLVPLRDPPPPTLVSQYWTPVCH